MLEATSQEIIQKFSEARVSGYGPTLPGYLDRHFSALVRSYRDSGESTREEIRASIYDKSVSLLVLGFSDRFATIAARYNDITTLRDALMAHVLEDFRYDPRENVLRLAIIDHVAERYFDDETGLLSSALPYCSDRAREQMTEFFSRPKQLRSLRCMHVLEAQTPDGVAFTYQS
jgi:hypothetical protein